MTRADGEPTLTERRQAVEIVEKATKGEAVHAGALADHLASALANQRAWIQARYETMARSLDVDACIGNGSRPEAQAQFDAATRIRQVAQ